MFQVSCPSKILLMGGYSILDPKNIGISLATDIRFSSKIFSEKGESNNIEFNIQTCQSQYPFLCTLNLQNLQITADEQNPFLLSSIEIFYKYIKIHPINLHFKKINIEFKIDSGFISNINTSKKTGLGSSACVVVNMIGCLLLQYNIYDKALLNFLSQLANNQAQQKIGSGFDINTCIFGTQIFQRKLIADEIQPDQFDSLKHLFEFNTSNSLNIQKSLKVFLIDISNGSDTRILVKNVQNYLNENPDKKKDFYKQSNQLCSEIITILQNKDFIDCRDINSKYRHVQQQLTKDTCIDVEPLIFTHILNDLLGKFKEIRFGVCPGAGGYDAACLLVDQVRLKYQAFQKSVLQNYLNIKYSDFKIDIIETQLSQEGVKISVI